MLKAGKKISCVKILPDCAYRKGKTFRPGKEKCYTLDERGFSLRILDKPQGYAVKDSSGKWISWIPSRDRNIPLFPFLLEFAKQRRKENGNAATVFLARTPCGIARIKVSPSIPEVREKIQLRILKIGKDAGEEKLRKAYQLTEIIDTFSRSPFFVVTNDEEVKRLLLLEIERSPRPAEIKEKLKSAAEKSVIVVDDPFLYAVESVTGSPELKIKQELPVRSVILVFLALVLAVTSGTVYLKKKREEEIKKREAYLKTVRQKWTPSPLFKKNHLAYLFLPTARDIERVIKALYPPEGFSLESVSINPSEIKFAYKTPYIVEGGKKKKDGYLLEKKIPRTPKPRWETLRGKKPKTIPSIKEVVRRYARNIQILKKEYYDGVLVMAAEVSISRVLSPLGLLEELKKASKTPMRVNNLEIKLRKDGFYTFQLKGKIYGVPED